MGSLNRERKEIMETIHRESAFRSLRRMIFIITLFVTAIALFTWCIPEAGAGSQRLYSSPEDALKSFAGAVSGKNRDMFNQILGPSARDLLSGDEVQDAAEFDDLAKHLTEKANLVRETDSKVTLHMGNENWPFPIPI